MRFLLGLQDPLVELTAFPQIPWLDFMGPTSKGGRRRRGERMERGEGEGRQSRREPQRGPGKHCRGALSPPSHSVCLEIETPKASRERKRGERYPLTIRLGVFGGAL